MTHLHHYSVCVTLEGMTVYLSTVAESGEAAIGWVLRLTGAPATAFCAVIDRGPAS